jgi:hypothetical protein
MSQIQLSGEMVNDILVTIGKHDERANQDMGLILQYLSAVSGFLLGHQNMSLDDKKAFLNELNGFAQHVLEDVEKQQAPEAAEAAEEDVGIWKPGDA